MTVKLVRLAAILATTSLLGACAAGDRLAGIGQPPNLSPIEDPTASKG